MVAGNSCAQSDVGIVIPHLVRKGPRFVEIMDKLMV